MSVADNKRKLDKEVRRLERSAVVEAALVEGSVRTGLWKRKTILSTCCLVVGRKMEKWFLEHDQ